MHIGFLKQHSTFIQFVQRILDLAVISGCGIASFYFSNAVKHVSGENFTGLPLSYLFVILLSLILTVVLFSVFSVYRVWRGSSALTQIKNLTMPWMMVGLCLAVLAFISKTGADYSRSWMLIWFVSTWVSLLSVRVVLRVILHKLRSTGYNHRHIVIIGTGEQAMVVAERLRASAWFGLEISALFGVDTGNLPPWLKDKRLISDVSALRQYVDTGDVDQVWIALPHSEESTIRDVITALDGSVAEIRYVPDVFEYQLMHHSLSEIAGVPVVNISYSAIDGVNKIIKNIEDYILATVLVVIASPLMLLLAIGVKFSSPGPILFRQRRVGWNGEEFTMLKFRSMPVEVESKSGPVWASKVDNRATAFGSFLRKTSLDELPQLLNVLKGEMSLIGPRPERPVFVEKYKDEVPHYMKKHLVKAGLTGWAQVHGWRGNTCLHTRIEHDLYYIENWSLWLDIKIFIMTIFRGFVHENAY